MLFSPQTAILINLFGIIGGLFGLIYAAIRLLRVGSRAGIISVFVALVSCIAFFVGIGINALLDLVEPRMVVINLIFGLITVLIGLILVRRERRADTFTASRSYGWLYTGVGVFSVIVTVMLPIIPTQWSVAPSVHAPTATNTATRTLAPTRTFRPQASSTPTLLPTLTATPTEVPTLTVTPTVGLPELPTRIIPTDTATPTALSIPDCTVRVASNVNLRVEPSTRGKLITTVKDFTNVPALARTADKSWWKIIYNDQIAWVSDQYVTPEANCKVVPTVIP